MKTKMKIRKSITKRFKVTKNGKVLRRVSFSGHLKEKKSGKWKLSHKKMVNVTPVYAKKIRKALGL